MTKRSTTAWLAGVFALSMVTAAMAIEVVNGGRRYRDSNPGESIAGLITPVVLQQVRPDAATATSTAGGPESGDWNGDGVVDGSDLLMLLSEWGECAGPPDYTGDLNGDGFVDGTDLLVLLGNWGPYPTLCTIQYDMESLDNAVGASATVMWLHRFDAGEGDVPSGIRTSYGTNQVAPGIPVSYAVYDANPDGTVGPLICTGVDQVEESAIMSSAVADRQVFTLPNIAVEGQFFIAVWESSGDFPAPVEDQGADATPSENVWAALQAGCGPGGLREC